MSQHPVEALLRPPVELYSTVAALSAAGLALLAPSAFLMTPAVADAAAGMLVTFGLWRGAQGWRVLAYQRGLRRLPSYVLAAEAIPVSRDWLFLGKGFRWTQRHTQRLWDLTRPGTERYLEPGMLYRWARRLEDAWPWSARLLSHRCSPLKALPPLGGLPALHGIGMPEGESDLRLPATERQGHIFVDGTTGVGKSALAELLITQDIRRGDTVIVFDPKGSANLFRRMYAEARRTGREFLFFHLGYPDRSARYNPIGRFERITEVATRLAGQLPSAGNAAAFREFAWLFVNVIARALVALGQKPDYRTILRYMANIEQLLVRYFEHWLEKEGGAGWREAVQQGGTFDRPGPGHLKGRDRRALALVRYYRESGLYDVVADGLRRAFELETSYFQKISVAAQPLLEKLLSGPVAGLINPNYGDPQDRRPILDFQKAIRTRAVVYIGLDALTDPEVAAVVGQSMLADLVSLGGQMYKHGEGHGLPGPVPKGLIQVHMDEFAELVRGKEIVQAVNKLRDIGFRFALYTQALADLEAGLGSRPMAEQIIGNSTNTLIMMRVADQATAELMTQRLDRVEVNALMLESGVTDSSDPDSTSDFVSGTRSRISSQVVSLLDPAHLMKLPKGQAFVLMEGGRLYKVRFPLPDPRDAALPADVAAIAADMHRRYRSDAHWADFDPSWNPAALEGRA